jgi:adenosylmethionine-8-amino-7-oxononanoate aminotransferase
MITQPPGFVRTIRQLCTEYDVFLIADEVAAGFGRTGTMFACDAERVTPDLMAVAKGLTGGYLPLAATLATERLYRGFLGPVTKLRTFHHGHTYTANPLGCAAALANLRLFRTEGTLRNVRDRTIQITSDLGKVARLSHVGDIRQCGLMCGVELVRDRDSKAPFPPRLRMGHRVIREARRRGVLLRPLGDVVVLMPPLGITRAETRLLVDVLRESIEAACRGAR